MSQSFIDQVTLDCLLNNEIKENHIIKQREKKLNKEDFKFYRKRIFNLFKEIISNNSPEDMSPDVKYAYITFINSSINYFKIKDKNDLLQEEYKDIQNSDKIEDYSDTNLDKKTDIDADKLLMRSVKINMPTLDKYIKKTNNKKNEKIILPKSRDVDITNPELKNKGLKKNNITNLYEKSDQK